MGFKTNGNSFLHGNRLLLCSPIQIGNAFLAGDALGLGTLDMGVGIGPAIRSGQLAAEAIITGAAYSVASIPPYSFPSLLGLRKSA
jgi:hypothetical protein